MSLRNVYRSYAIERDAEGKPYRMIWCGDYVRHTSSVTYLACPRCQSKRMVGNRCLDCWLDARNVTEKWVEKS